jgi:beta-barrel assembly-enhancing protease
MFARVASLRLWLHRRWLYSCICALTISIVTIGQPQVSQAAEWWQLLIQGAQIVQLSNMSDAQEASLGLQTNQSLLSDKVRIYQNQAVNNYVNQIGQRLARNSARPNIKYTFQVVEDDGINAFATMGGFVYVNTGLLKAADNEAQLAGVIGHEIGHITGRHALQHLKQAAITQGISSLAGVDRDTYVQMAVQLALTLPNSRQDEYDADRRGLTTMIQSGYAPTAMPEFMKKLMRGGSSPEFLSSHPAVSERVSNLQRMIPAAYKNRTDGLNANSYKQNLQSFF